MKDKNEINKMELEQLNLRLAETEAERDRIQKEMEALRSSMTKADSTSLWSRVAVAAVSVLTVTTLLYTGVFHDAQSNVKDNDPLSLSAMSSPGTGLIMRSEAKTTKSKKPAKSSKKIYRSKRKPSQKQWGPALVIPKSGTKKTRVVYDPIVKEQQQSLMTLGFDIKKADGLKGAGTRRALEEFRALYLPDSAEELDDAGLAVLLTIYANLARSDAAKFGVDHGVVAAIRLSSVRTGVDFSYLMKLAATESNFKPAVTSRTSSATGLYQFTHDTWLNTLQTHGAKYGPLADYVTKIEHYKTKYGYQRPIVREKSLYKHLLALRKNPRISAMMAAETVRDHQQLLSTSFKREPKQTDLYLTHFLGADAAITFLQSLERSPSTNAVELFPEAANSNHDIFHPQVCEPRTIDEVYALFGEKFTTSRYDDFGSN